MILLLGSDWLLYDSALCLTDIPAPAYMNDSDLVIHLCMHNMFEWTKCMQIQHMEQSNTISQFQN